MKKLMSFLCFLVIVGGTSLISPNPAKAGCAGKTINQNCPSINPVQCFVSGYLGENFCCNTERSCEIYAGGGVVVSTTQQNQGENNDIINNNINPTDSNQDSLWCDSDKTELNTAIGCIPILSSKEEFLSFLLRWAVGIGGGIAFLLIVYAGFMIMTSAGNPERLKAGQELLTSAISGLLLLIFSVVILKIIGVDILGLGKFGFGQ